MRTNNIFKKFRGKKLIADEVARLAGLSQKESDMVLIKISEGHGAETIPVVAAGLKKTCDSKEKSYSVLMDYAEAIDCMEDYAEYVAFHEDLNVYSISMSITGFTDVYSAYTGDLCGSVERDPYSDEDETDRYIFEGSYNTFVAAENPDKAIEIVEDTYQGNISVGEVYEVGYGDTDVYVVSMHGSVMIEPETAEMLEKLCTKEPRSRKECFSEDEKESYTVKFSDGKEMDIECCGVQYERGGNNTAWTQAVLYNPPYELVCTEPSDDMFGEWELEYDGIRYVANVIDGRTVKSEEVAL